MIAPSGSTPTPSFNIPATVIQTIASDVLHIPTPFSIIGGIFGGGKMHPGRYAFEFVWNGITWDRFGYPILNKIYRRRLYRAGKYQPGPYKAVGNMGYLMAWRLCQIIKNRLPLKKRQILTPLFMDLNKKFHTVTMSVHLKRLRQQGPALAAFDALKWTPAILNTYGNAVRQMINPSKPLEKFITEDIGAYYVNPFGYPYQAKWFEKRYCEWLSKNLGFRSPTIQSVRNWMARTGMKTYNLIVLPKTVSKPKPKPKPKTVKKPTPKKPPKKLPAVKKQQVENIAQMKEVITNLQEKQKGILDYLKMLGPSVAYAGSIEEFAKSSGHGTPVQQITIKGKGEEKSVFDFIDIGDMLLFGAIAVPAVLLLTKRKR